MRTALAQRLPAEEVRRLAAKLAQAQRADVLRSLLADLPEDDLGTELGACLLHEMILRGKPVTGVVGTWRRRLAAHPLGDLPLTALPGEAALPLPRYSVGSYSYDSPLGLDRTDPLILAGTVPEATREDVPPDITAAVRTWPSLSNGRAEAGVFTLVTPLKPAEVGYRTIESLGLECLAGGGLALRCSDLDEVMRRLFAAAAYGGAYDRGLGGAYGREAAWRSVTALTGGSHEGCAWWTFDAANDWFFRTIRDLGVVCLRPNGHVMAVLAATDSD